MATLLRLARPCRAISAQFLRSRQVASTPACHISLTSITRGSDGAIVEKTPEIKELEEHFADTDVTKLKNWVSHSWHETDRDMDKFAHNVVMFSLVTVLFVFGSFVLAYFPDYKLREWSTREAYLEIDRREKLGLPIIDPYMIPADQIQLPSEEEIGDQEIII